jgi:hypothetical protein
MYVYFSVALMLLFAGLIAALIGPEDMLIDGSDGIHLALIAITWPLCAIGITLIMSFEIYKDKLCRKVEDKVNMLKKDLTNVEDINTKDLKLILFANKLGAISIHDKLIDKVKSSLIDRSFEDHILKK